MELAQILVLLLIILSIILMGLIIAYVVIVIKSKQQNKNHKNVQANKETISKDIPIATNDKESIYNFMEFDEIKDNMIIRKNRKQYVMVVKCKGVNYDLMSEEEKVSVESGFVQFLNTLRFPIQLYIQTTSLNLRDTIEEYKNRLRHMEKEIRDIDSQLEMAKARGNSEAINKLSFEKLRRENVFDYSADISDYIEKMSMNRNILQQKTYLVISYYVDEMDRNENLSKEDVDNICFSELYTRTQTAIRALGSSGIVGKILNSEELSELVYVAYNRDESEVMQLSRALDAEYDALYSTGKDALEKKQEVLDEAIDREAVDLATSSIKIADEKIKKKQKVKERALDIVEEYKEQMSQELYNQTKEEIQNKSNEEEQVEIKKIKRGRPKKTIS